MATRWGIASAGKISHDFVTALSTLSAEEHKVVAVAAQQLERAEKFATEHNIPNAYGSYEELAKDPNVEVVYIGTVNSLHFDIGKLMLNHGKHVLCEKPLTLNVKQSKELIDLAKKKKLFLMEAIWSRCFPAYDALKKELESGLLGDILQVMVGFGVVIDDIDRVKLKELGGGTILDLGVYVLQFSQYVFGPSLPESIEASGYLNENGVDTSTSITLKYKGGKTSTLITHSKVKLPNEAFIIGTKGTIKVNEPFWCPTSFTTPEKTKEFILPTATKTFNFTNSAGLRYEAIEVRRCLKQGLLESPKVSHQESLTIAQLQDEIRNQIVIIRTFHMMATRWGIVSAGKISHDFVTALSTLSAEEHKVVAVAAQQLDRAKKFATEHNIPNAYGSYEELAKDPNVEVAYIGNINTQHLEVSKLMLNHGKHVLCEKPLTLNLKQSKELIELAKKKKLFLMEAIWSRCFPVYDALKKELESNSLGEVLQVTATIGVLNAEVERVRLKETGGGNILNIAVYALQFAQFVFGPSAPENVLALGNLNENGVDTNTSIILKYKGGKIATLTTHGKAQMVNDAYVVGTKGYVKVSSPFWCPTTITTPSGTTEFQLPTASKPFHFPNSAGLRYEAIEVRRCLKQGILESQYLTHAESLVIAQLQDEIRRQVGVKYDED
ncbi:hypothetical protein L9F63_010310 [Diploptera punctata]|uniref:Trans-1,2-dihydrobenzene-1,2-diol dehydrogenase n=1 Tax=Diploptera punctata TaxID=6984 RepID=A0AAD8AHK3_DIPPU|nr:hypothetical protein L9F63_010310 [Diploptera punctata]